MTIAKQPKPDLSVILLISNFTKKRGLFFLQRASFFLRSDKSSYLLSDNTALTIRLSQCFIIQEIARELNEV